jgi:hypothetical protein
MPIWIPFVHLTYELVLLGNGGGRVGRLRGLPGVDGADGGPQVAGALHGHLAEVAAVPGKGQHDGQRRQRDGGQLGRPPPVHGGGRLKAPPPSAAAYAAVVLSARIRLRRSPLPAPSALDGRRFGQRELVKRRASSEERAATADVPAGMARRRRRRHRRRLQPRAKPPSSSSP